MDEPPVPRCLETLLTLSECSIRDLKDCLFLAAHSTESSVQIQMAVQEKVIAPDSVAERSFSIVEFSHALTHRRIQA